MDLLPVSHKAPLQDMAADRAVDKLVHRGLLPGALVLSEAGF